MKKLFFLPILFAAAASSAQTTNKAITEHDPAVKTKDSLINAEVIKPARAAADGEAPDWKVLIQTITQKYDAVTADRTITKAKIYFYYGKDWAQFCAGIVHYTDNWELADDYNLLNKNAGMILKNSDDKAQLKEAQKWSKAAADSDPNNNQYRATYDALTAKIAGN